MFEVAFFPLSASVFGFLISFLRFPWLIRPGLTHGPGADSGFNGMTL
jgi:hypothetical protein